MLYQIHEYQRAFWTPLSGWADSVAKLYDNPYSPLSYSPFARRAAAGLEVLHRIGKNYQKPGWQIHSTKVEGIEVPVFEREVVTKPFCRLLKFERLLPKSLSKHEAAPIVLVVAPLSGHHATLLRDTVRTLVQDNNVYVTDWIDARMVPLSAGRFNLDDYVAYTIEFLRLLGPKVHVMSVCQPTVPVMAAVSLMSTWKDPAVPRSMTMMGGPIDTRSSPTSVNDLATTRSYDWFESNVICTVPSRYPGAGRRVYPGFLQHAGFVAMNPDRHATSHWDFYKDLVRGDLEDVESHKQFYDEYNAVLDLSADYYLQTISTVFQKHLLPLGQWEVEFEGKKHLVRPQDIKNIALLTVEGELDDISGSGQTQAAHTLCTGIPKNKQEHVTAEGAGHYGIFSGRRWREIIYPKVREFMQKNA
jgi:poly(3-hydroxybutyrate) depolymerase